MSQRTLTQFVLQNKALVAVLAFTVVVALYITGKILLKIVHFNDPRHHDQALRNWMTPQYVMKSYDLPRLIIDETFDIDPNSEKRRKMRHIARRMNLTLEELTEQIRQSAKL